jgi:hypothetical protein
MPTQKPEHGCYGSFIFNWPNLEAAKISFSRRMDKEPMMHPDSGILFCTNKLLSVKMWKNLKHCQTKGANLKRPCTV